MLRSGALFAWHQSSLGRLVWSTPAGSERVSRWPVLPTLPRISTQFQLPLCAAGRARRERWVPTCWLTSAFLVVVSPVEVSK